MFEKTAEANLLLIGPSFMGRSMSDGRAVVFQMDDSWLDCQLVHGPKCPCETHVDVRLQRKTLPIHFD